MKVTDTSYYGHEVYDFKYSPDPAVNELNESQLADTERYHEFKIVESQSGTEIIVTRVQDGDESRFRFKLTDEATQQCRYTGDDADDIPPTVLHAIHENGYSVTNVMSLGDWFNIWLDVKLVRIALHDLVADPTDPIHEDILKDVGMSLYGLEELAGARYLVDDPGTFASLVDNSERFELLGPIGEPRGEADDSGDESGEIIRNVEVNPEEDRLLTRIPDECTTQRQAETFDLDQFEVKNVVVKAVFPTDESTAFVDTLTPWGVERFRFQLDGSCHYVKSEAAQSKRPNSYVIDAIQAEGYDVSNATSVFESVDTGAVVRSCVDILDELSRIDAWRGQEKQEFGAEMHVASITKILMLRLLIAVEVGEIAPEAYERWRATYDELYQHNPNAAPTIIGHIVNELDRDRQKELADRLEKSTFIQRSVIGPNYRNGLHLVQNIGTIL